MSPRGWIAAFAGTLVLAAPAGAVPVGSTALVDRPSGFGTLPFDGAGTSGAGPHALSGNGCFAVFDSSADSLLSSDEDAATLNVYRVDRCSAGNPIVQVNTTA